MYNKYIDKIKQNDQLKPPVFIFAGYALNLSQVVCPIFLLNNCSARLIS